MSIELLSRRLTPPQNPVETIGDWDSIENAIGVSLPDDFKSFINIYGSGTIGEFLTIFNPFSTRPGLNFVGRSKQQLDALRYLQSRGESCPFRLFPEKNGLLPVAMTDNGDVIHWLTSDNPTDWTIVVNESRSPEYERFNYNLTTFIEKVIDGSIHVGVFPDDWPPSQSTFRVL